jgi:hypothetical protein
MPCRRLFAGGAPRLVPEPKWNSAQSEHVFLSVLNRVPPELSEREVVLMHDIIYLVGLVVVVMFILSALGLR